MNKRLGIETVVVTFVGGLEKKKPHILIRLTRIYPVNKLLTEAVLPEQAERENCFDQEFILQSRSITDVWK